MYFIEYKDYILILFIATKECKNVMLNLTFKSVKKFKLLHTLIFIQRFQLPNYNILAYL